MLIAIEQQESKYSSHSESKCCCSNNSSENVSFDKILAIIQTVGILLLLGHLWKFSSVFESVK